MSSPSLRDLYAPPPNSWSFSAPPTNASDVGNTASEAASVSYQWSTRQTSRPLLGLSGTMPDDEGLDVKALMVGLFTSALLQYATTAVAVPWEGGKTLLQVQWIPRDIDTIPLRDYTKEHDEEEEVCLNLSLSRIAGLKMSPCLC